MNTLIIKYGEIALKGKNRNYFESILMKNIKNVLTEYEDIEYRIEHGRFFLEIKEYEHSKIIEKVKDVFGIVGIAPSIKTNNSISEMNVAAEKLVRDLLKRDPSLKTFKVETNRVNKGFEYISPEVSRRVGGYINQTFDEISVDVHTPDIVVSIEIRKDSYVYVNETPAYGGMPYGTGGKAMVLLSGGIDSPVAAWMMARRGVALQGVHFHIYPFTSKRATEKVLGLGQKLSKYIGKIKIHSVNILDVYKAIQENCPDREFTIHARRFMTMIAERVAIQNGCKALITGENIAQVASQTLESIHTTNSVSSMPIFRPLLAYDKQDIIEVAKDIDTYDVSILPYEDCCTVFLPDKVVTRPRLDIIEQSEEALDTEKLIEQCLETLETYEIDLDTDLSY